MLYRLKQLPHNPILFLFGGVYLWLVVEPRLIYQCFGNILSDAPIFVTGWSFLRSSLAMPGGFVMYVAGFLSQGYYYSWLGTVVIVLSALFLCELSRRHLLAAGYMRPTVLVSIPAILLFLICSRYKHPLPACLAVSLGLLCSLVFERLPWRRPAIRTAVYCLIAALVFWLAGAGGLLIFSLMTIIHGALVRRDLILPILALPAGLVIIWGFAEYVFLIPPRQAFLVLTPFSPAVFKKGLVFAAPIILMAVGFCFSYDRMGKTFLLAHTYCVMRIAYRVLSPARRRTRDARRNSQRILQPRHHSRAVSYGQELGQVNLAEKLASEILATKKHCGPVVEKLAWINIEQMLRQESVSRISYRVLRIAYFRPRGAHHARRRTRRGAQHKTPDH